MQFTPKNGGSCTKSLRTPYYNGYRNGSLFFDRRMSPARDNRHNPYEYDEYDDFGTTVHDMSEPFSYPDMSLNKKTYSRIEKSRFPRGRVTSNNDKYQRGSGPNRRNTTLPPQRNNSYSIRKLPSPQGPNMRHTSFPMRYNKNDNCQEWRGRKQNYDCCSFDSSDWRNRDSGRQLYHWKPRPPKKHCYDQPRNGRYNKSPGSFYGPAVKQHYLASQPLKDRGSVDNLFEVILPEPSPEVIKTPPKSYCTKSPVKRSCSTHADTPFKKNKVEDEPENKENNSLTSRTTGQPWRQRGFVNLGNTCYMNAVLQAIFSLAPLAESLLSVYRTTKEKLPEKCLLRSICKLLLERNSPVSTYARNHFEPILTEIKSMLDMTLKNFKGSAMQDAHEFLTKILEKINDEVNEVLEDADYTSRQPSTTLHNPIKYYFEYGVKDTITCTQCGNTVYLSQKLYDMGLSVPKKKKSLQSCINSLYKCEKWEFLCKKCQHLESVVRHVISQLPRFLCIHLKRYIIKNNEVVKKYSPVLAQKFLTLHKVASDDANIFEHSNVPPCKGVDIPDVRSLTITKSTTNGCQEVAAESAESHSSLSRLFGGYRSPLEDVSQEGTPDNKQSTTKSDRQECMSEDDVLVLDESDGLLTNVTWPNKDVVSPASDANNNKATQADSKEADLPQDDDEDENIRKAKQISLLEFEESQKQLETGESDDEEEADEVEDDCNENENLSGDLPHSYQLSVVVCHTGSASIGHYVCYAYDFYENVFRLYDDKSVTVVDEKEALANIQKSGYLYIYVNRNI